MTFITMTEKEMNKILIIKSLLDEKIDIETAQKRLNVGERSIYRYIKRFKENWANSLVHWLRNKPSNNQTRPMDKLKKYALKKKYEWFWPTLLAEELEKELGWWKINPESLRIAMIRWWIWVPHKRKIKKKKRVRKEREWEMIQFDGSYHNWLEDGEQRCVLLAIDDATSKIKKLKMTKWETLEDMIEFWKEYFMEYGKPESIYVDRHATYKVNNWNKDMFDEEKLTRFAKAMWKLWVLVIYARTPEWKWRVERWFRTLQDRMVKKMRLANIKDEVEANEYMEKIYKVEHNKKYSKKAVLWEDMHQPLTSIEKERFEWYFAKETIRKIRKDGIVKYNKKAYQIKKWERLYNWYTVRVLEIIDWKVEIYSWNIKLSIEKIYSSD